MASRPILRALAVTVVFAPLLSATPAHAACYEQRIFTGREGTVYDIPGGQPVAYWYGQLYYGGGVSDKINVHAYWNSSWIGGNVYRPDNTRVATGYVLKQYTAFSRWIC